MGLGCGVGRMLQSCCRADRGARRRPSLPTVARRVGVIGKEFIWGPEGGDKNIRVLKVPSVGSVVKILEREATFCSFSL